jgi:hypothetical protein
MIKSLVCLAWSLILLIGTFLPEGALYLVYHFVNPQTELARVLLSGIMLWFGVGVSLMFFIFGFIIWFTGIIKIIEA